MRAPWRWLQFLVPQSKGADFGALQRYLAWAGGIPTSAGISVTPLNAMQSMAVYACVKVLSESVGMLPCHLQTKMTNGGREDATEHPLYPLLHDQPNDYQTAPEFWEMLVTHMCLRGNAYAWVNRTKRGDVVELIPLWPDSVRCEQLANQSLVYHLTLTDGSVRDLGMGEVMHCRGLTLNGWLGVSPITYARESIGLALASEKFGSLLFSNGAKMGGVLEHPGKLSDAAYTRIKETFDLATSGENAHRTAVIEEGMKFSKVAMSNEDSQFLETRKYQRAEIAAIYRVPPHMIGDLEKATFSNIEQQSLEFATYALMPWLVRLEKTVKRDLLRPGEKKDMALKFNTAALMRGDAKSRADYYASGIVNGWMTRNEARKSESAGGMVYNPLPDLDEPLMPLNMIVVGQEPAATAEPGASTSEPGSGGTPQNPPASVGNGQNPPTVHGRDTALADAIGSLAIAIARAPPPHVDARVDLAGATVHHGARPALERLEFVFDGDGNIVGAESVTGE